MSSESVADQNDILVVQPQSVFFLSLINIYYGGMIINFFYLGRVSGGIRIA